MKITQALLDGLTEQAKASPRLRMNYDLRNSAEDKSQRMLNAIEPGSPLPIHRHTKSSETVVCLRGRLVWEFYEEGQGSPSTGSGTGDSGSEAGMRDTEAGMRGEAVELTPNGPVVALNIPIGQWHTVRALESGSVILEMKDGAYEPLGETDILSL